MPGEQACSSANRLADASSPYLLQHAYNPVDWYPWSEEALQKARAEDKPVFLSVGYSACHWCHVMAHESFEDEAVAAILNEHFVSIKVDREEHPDVDAIYMSAVQLLTGSGGWPMSVFLTPDLKPFYGGTYFPPTDQFGRPSFTRILGFIIEVWTNRRAEAMRSADELAAAIRSHLSAQPEPEEAVTQELLSEAVTNLRQRFDMHNGGFGEAPKFPPAASIRFLLRQATRLPNEDLLSMATHTLRQMAKGGIYDHLGGGFHRYSVDAQWLVPHFEKMLYDNAQLVPAYLEAWQVTGDDFYRRVATETMDYVLRDMTDPEGGFYSAEDADSEGEEGKFYLWTQAEIVDRLGAKDGSAFCANYNVRETGNFSSHEPFHKDCNILHVTRSADKVAKDFGASPEDFGRRLSGLRARLQEVRGHRIRPLCDDKVLTSWNALMISALAQGAQVTGDDRYLVAADRAADFILDHMRTNSQLLHVWRAGTGRLSAYLDDYAFLTMALVDLYEASFDPRRLAAARDLANEMIARFWDEAEGGFFFTTAHHSNLIARAKPTFDGAEPSGNSMAVIALLRLARFFDNHEYYNRAEQVLALNAARIRQVPQGYPWLLIAADLYLYPPLEIAFAGEKGESALALLIRTLHKHFVPNKIVALAAPTDDAGLAGEMPLLTAKRPVAGKAAAYVCKNFTCKSPATSPEEFESALGLGTGKMP